MDPILLRLGSLVGASVVLVAGCVVAAVVHLRRLQKHRSPGVAELVEQAERAAGSNEPVELVLGELSEAVGEAEQALALATMLPRSLSRVSLASGTSIAILVLISGPGLGGGPSVVAALVAFSVGMVGAGACGALGRAAREEAGTARAKWRKDFRSAVEVAGGHAVWTEGRRPR